MKIAILGSAPSSCALAPYQDQSFQQFQQGKTQAYPPAPHINEEWEIWGCSPGLFGYAMRATRWFELHRWEPGQQWFSPEYCQFLREFKGPVYTGGPIPEIKNHVVYPLERVEDQFSAFFLTSSLSLMAALAIQTIEAVRMLRRAHAGAPNAADHEAAKFLSATGMMPDQIAAELTKPDTDDVIGLWGVDMSANEEYQRQRPGCWFFGLQILERGIGLFYPPESDLFCPEPVYGICEWDHEYIKATARMKELTGRLERGRQQAAVAQADVAAVTGAVDDMNYFIKTWLAAKYKLPAGQVIHKVPKPE